MADKSSETVDVSQPLPPLEGWTLTFLSWLVPGAGFMVLGQYRRALALFALIEIPFVIGVILGGAVVTRAYAESLGAAYAKDGVAAVRVVEKLMMQVKEIS